MAFPTALSAVVDNVTTIAAAHINNIETTLKITTDRTKFSAYCSSTQENVTGDGTDYTCVFDSEVFDTGADFASNTFTAPVTGQYLLCATVRIAGLTSNNTSGYVRIVTSNREYIGTYINPYASTLIIFNVTCIADMDASDTAYVKLLVSATDKGVDEHGAANGNNSSRFMGALII